MTTHEPYPVGAEVIFRAGNYKGRRGVIEKYALVKHLESRGQMALVKLENGGEHYCLRFQDIKLVKKSRGRKGAAA